MTGLYATPKELKVVENVVVCLVRMLTPSLKKGWRRKNLSLCRFRWRKKTITRRNGWKGSDPSNTLYLPITIKLLLTYCLLNIISWHTIKNTLFVKVNLPDLGAWILTWSRLKLTDRFFLVDWGEWLQVYLWGGGRWKVHTFPSLVFWTNCWRDRFWERCKTLILWLTKL